MHVLSVLPLLQQLEILPVCDQDGGEPLHELVALYSAPPCSEATPLPDVRRVLARARRSDSTRERQSLAEGKEATKL